VNATDKGVYGRPNLRVFKVGDTENFDPTALNGAEFTIKYYDVTVPYADENDIDPATVDLSSKTPARQWTFKTRKMPTNDPTVIMAGFDWDSDDIVSPSLDTELTGFAEVTITTVEYKTTSEEQVVEYETEIIKSKDMYVDESEIVTPGVNGKKLVYYSEKYVGGTLEETEVSREETVKEPVNEIKKIGTKSRETLAAYKNTGSPISELSVPADLELDENGIPVNYTKCVDAKATAYTGDPATASGRKPMPGHIAVDPKEYPYGTELYIVSADGSYVYGYCVAADTGGFVSMGNTDVDLYLDNEDMCYDWGNRNIKIVFNKRI